MTGMIDMHCHLMPGVDDGARDAKELRKMLKMEYASGVRTIILTPHYRQGMYEPSKESVIRNYKRVKKMVSLMKLEMKVYLGCEYYARDNMISHLKREKYLRINGGKFVLIEFSGLHSFHKMRNWVNELVCEDLIPVIAHAERYPQLMKDWNYLDDLRTLGAWIQVDSASLLGKQGWLLKRKTGQMLKKGYIDVIASDAHDTKDACPNLDLCAKYVIKKVGKEKARELFVTNPQMILGINNKEKEDE